MVINNNEIQVILAKRDGCGYCTMFQPIFEMAKKICEIEKPHIKFESYDHALPQEENNFNQTYKGFNIMLEGFPTIFLQFKVNDKIKNTMADTTQINTKLNKTEEELVEEAAHRFIENVLNQYKTYTSTKNETFVSSQKGGDLYYKAKYLKYKSKYLSLLE